MDKFDGLLRESIAELARENLQQRGPVEELQSGLLCGDISGLWKISSVAFPQDLVNYYSQWDDSWLLGVLRREYFVRKAKRARGPNEETNGPERREALEIQLEEILSNTKHYYSLFKRLDAFLRIDKAFLHAARRNFNLKILKARSKGNTMASKRVSELSEFFNDYNKGLERGSEEQITNLYERRGLFLNALLNLLAVLGLGGKGGMSFVFKAASLSFESHETDSHGPVPNRSCVCVS